MLSIFSCVHCPSVCLLWRNVYVGLLPIFQLVGCFLLFSYTSCLYILESKPLSVASFVNMLYHSLSCLFILFMVSFVIQKLVSLIRSDRFNFAFVSIALVDWPQKRWYDLFQRMFCLHSLLGVLWYQCHILYLSV